MLDANNKEKTFNFIIEEIKQPDGSTTYKTLVTNTLFEEELIIMQMRAYLQRIERNYFNSFDQASVGLAKE